MSCFFRSIFKKSNITNSRRCGANPPTSVQDLLFTSFVSSSDLPTLPSIVWCLNGRIIWYYTLFLFIFFSIPNFTWNLQATLCSQLGRTSQATPRLGSRFKILNSDRICFFAIYGSFFKILKSVKAYFIHFYLRPSFSSCALASLSFAKRLCSSCNLKIYIYIQGAFFNASSSFSVPKWKKLAQPTRSFFTLKISWKIVLVGCDLFFILVLKIGRNG